MSLSFRPHRSPFLFAVSIAALAAARASGGPADDGADLEKPLEHFNRGISLMERHQAGEAIAEFQAVVDLQPEWLAGRINLGIAYLNCQKEPLLPKGEKVFREVLRRDPKNPYGHYCLAMLYMHWSRFAEAEVELKAALEVVPHDAYTLYNLGSIARRANRPKEAEEYFRRAVEVNNAFASATYSLSRLAFTDGRRDEGKKHAARFQELEKFHVGIKVGLKYTEMGTYSDVIRLAVPGSRSMEPPPQIAYKDISAAAGLGAAVSGAKGGGPRETEGAGIAAVLAARLGPRVARGDFDGDGDVDLFVPGAGGGSDRLLRNDGGKFIDALAEAGIQSTGAAIAAAFGDYDGDGKLDLVLARVEGIALFHNEGAGKFKAVDGALPQPGFIPSAVVFGDADHDGDLDIVIVGYGARPAGGGKVRIPEDLQPAPSMLCINLGTGKFEAADGKCGFPGAPCRGRDAIFTDLDADGDSDIVLAAEDGSIRIYWNDRALRFREAKSGEAISGARVPQDAVRVLAPDLDRNELPDLVVLSAEGPAAILRNRGRGKLEAESLGLKASAAAAADLDLDGDLDLILAGGDSSGAALAVLINDGTGRLSDATAAVGLAGAPAGAPPAYVCLPDLTGDGLPDILLAGGGEPCRLLASPKPAGVHWLGLRLRGVPDKEDLFSNRFGVGARVEVKAGDRWHLVEAGAGGAEIEPIAGLGPRAKADYVRVFWTDGTIQSEMEVSGDRVYEIGEIQRKASSCPLLFTWDGERFRFITDLLGTGGLGFYMAPGVYAPPDPTEDVRIPPGALREKDGRLEVRLAEPLEEVVYLDAVSLLAVDHPAGTAVYPDERFATAPPEPSGRILQVGREVAPAAARDERRRDVTARILASDRIYPEIPREKRFAGYAKDHWLELDFAGRLAPLAAAGRSVALFLDGWVEYTYSRVNFAAGQAGLSLHPPSIEIPDGSGGWKAVLPEFGYPAGLPRILAVELPRAAVEAGRLRIRTDMEIYWDRAFAAAFDVVEPQRIAAALPASADLRSCGYPREYSPDGREPALYDYHRKDPAFPFRNIAGAYTRMGDVRELVLAGDDRFIIFGRGEEVALTFRASDLPAPPPGTERTFVLRLRGYCKDRDPYTALGETVEPLPYAAMTGYPYGPEESYPSDEAHRESLERWNTRKVMDR